LDGRLGFEPSRISTEREVKFEIEPFKMKRM
jgi:hypothetical protein